jgi:hypothetical protein
VLPPTLNNVVNADPGHDAEGISLIDDRDESEFLKNLAAAMLQNAQLNQVLDASSVDKHFLLRATSVRSNAAVSINPPSHPLRHAARQYQVLYSGCPAIHLNKAGWPAMIKRRPFTCL